MATVVMAHAHRSDGFICQRQVERAVIGARELSRVRARAMKRKIKNGLTRSLTSDAIASATILC
jgi:hypothetical protein